jgi:hypothetical protein
MARLQILELPTEPHGDDMTTPWILVIDQVDEDTAADIARWPDDIAKRTGARHVLCFSDTVDIPANNVIPPGSHYEVTGDGQPVTWTKADEARAEIIDKLRRATNRDA